MEPPAKCSSPSIGRCSSMGGAGMVQLRLAQVSEQILQNAITRPGLPQWNKRRASETLYTFMTRKPIPLYPSANRPNWTGVQGSERKGTGSGCWTPWITRSSRVSSNLLQMWWGLRSGCRGNGHKSVRRSRSRQCLALMEPSFPIRKCPPR
jgi:hypothetical protein